MDSHNPQPEIRKDVRLIFDAHLDLAWNALAWNRDLTEPLAQLNSRETGMSADHRGRGRATVSLPEMRRAGVAACLGTLLVRANRNVQPPTGHLRRDLDVATHDIACAHARGQLAYYELLARRGELRLLRTHGDLRAHWAWCEAARGGNVARGGETPPPLGMILAMEGADPIVEPRQVEWWWNVGLRVVGLAHYGQGHYAYGTGGEGPLAPRAAELLREMRHAGMILDLTHSSDPSFFQALDQFDGPVLASHNNCRALVPGDRQYSDEQILRLIDRGGVVGAALDAWMLMPGYVKGETPRDAVPLTAVVDHIDHVCQLAGNSRHAAIGSDLDGGFGTEQTPAGLETIADLQKLDGLLKARGYMDEDVDNIFHANWLRFFTRWLPE